MIKEDFTGAVYERAPELESAAADKLTEYQAALEDQFGDMLLGIEDEFTIHGIHYSREDELLEYLTERLSDKFGSAFSSIDHEHPLMRVRDSIAAGENQALHIPNTFRLELVTNHEPEFHETKSHVVNKAEMLTQMREEIWHAVEDFQEHAVVSWNPRPIDDIYSYLIQVCDMPEDEILDNIKDQALEREDLIGRERILAAENLEELLLGADAPIDNKGAAGSGVHINIGFVGKDGVNPFYNADDPDIGTPVTWNTSAGIIDVTSESVLPFINLANASWKRIGNTNLSASSEACYHPLKKGGAIVKQNPQSVEFYEEHGVPYKVGVNEKNAHIEVRHCDAGAGVKDGSALIMLQLCTTMAGMHHGLRQDKIGSYEELMQYRKPLCDDYAQAVDGFQSSKLMMDLLGDRLHSAVIDHVSDPSRGLEGTWCASLDAVMALDEDALEVSS